MSRQRPDVNTIELCLRLDEPTHRQLTAKAKRSVRSLNGEIVWRLRRSIEEQKLDEPTA
jgi:predicted HicB family RNase H-like nuclease